MVSMVLSNWSSFFPVDRGDRAGSMAGDERPDRDERELRPLPLPRLLGIWLLSFKSSQLTTDEAAEKETRGEEFELMISLLLLLLPELPLLLLLLLTKSSSAMTRCGFGFIALKCTDG